MMFALRLIHASGYGMTTRLLDLAEAMMNSSVLGRFEPCQARERGAVTAMKLGDNLRE